MNHSDQTERARELRRRQTDAEHALWQRLRRRQLDGFKFRRQQPIGPYIVDFVSFEAKLIIEIDGGQHNGADAKRLDRTRSEWLRSNGYRVLRFWNHDVLQNENAVVERIRQEVKRPPSP